MERVLAVDHLAKAERHVSEGELRLEYLRELIQQLRDGRYDTTKAEELLRTLEQTQELHLANLAHIREELASISGNSPGT